MKSNQRRVLGGILLLGAFLAACAQAQAPTLVASYPLTSSVGDSSRSSTGNPVVVETVYLSLEVKSPDGAADQAQRLAVGYGGYETQRYGWNSDGVRNISQEILIPLDRAESLRSRLLEMGRKTREETVRTSKPWYGPGDAWAQFSIQYLEARSSSDWDRTRPDWDYSFKEDILNPVCAFLQALASIAAQWAAAFLIAAAVVIPCLWMLLGAVTSIRWLFRR